MEEREGDVEEEVVLIFIRERAACVIESDRKPDSVRNRCSKIQPKV